MHARAIFLLLFLFGYARILLALSVGQQRRVGNSVARAIEMTKRRQAFDNAASTSADTSAAVSSSPSTTNRQKSNPRPVRTEYLDAGKLNLLLKSIDKTWVLPRIGAREPIGSNFQYKKTCASIYKGRSGACQQIGFGVMCFNYCYEKSEELVFKCQDISEPSYCRSNANYENFFTKHRKDAYKVKAFVHQMISRCYATAICNNQAILNTTQFGKLSGGEPKLPKDLPTSILQGRQQSKIKTNANSGMHQRTSKQSIWDRYAVSSRQETQPPPPSSNSGVIGPPTPESEFEGAQPKYVPFWQRLLKRKNSTTITKRPTNQKTTTEKPPKIEDLSMEEEEASIKDKAEEVMPEEYPDNTDNNENVGNLPAENEEDDEDILVAVATTTLQPTTTTKRTVKRRRLRPVRPIEKSSTSSTTTTTTQTPYDLVDEEDEITTESQTKRYTWKPLEIKTTSTTSNPCGFQGRSAVKSDAPQESAPEGFWTKFQPGRWFQSLHYMTNTG